MKAYNDTTALLMAARMLISDQKAWTKHELARDKKGDGVEPETKEAVKFCLLGSMDAFQPTVFIKRDAKERLHKQIKCNLLATFNDFNSHKKVLAVLDAAINAED